MKLPGKIGQAQELTRPTRRKLLQMGAAALVPKPPIAVGEILEGVRSISSVKGLKIQYPKLVYKYLKDGSIRTKSKFPSGAKEWLKQQLSQEIDEQEGVIGSILGCEIGNCLDREKSYIGVNPESFGLNHDLGGSTINGQPTGFFSMLQLHLCFNITDSNGQKLRISTTLAAPEVGEENMDLTLDEGQTIWIDILNANGEREGEYEYYNPGLSDKEVLEILKKPISGIVSELKSNMIGRFEDMDAFEEAKKQEEQKLKEQQSLPMVRSEFSELIESILSGKIDIDDTVRQRVGYLLSL